MLSLTVPRAVSEQPTECDEHCHFDGLGVYTGADAADEDCEQSKGSDDEDRYSCIAVRLTMWFLPAPLTGSLNRKPVFKK